MTIFATPEFTLFHVAISLVGIVAGAIVLDAMLANKPLGLANHVFLVTTIATSATGFLFPFKGFDPAIGVGIVSIIVLGVAVAALYLGQLEGIARPAYTISATFALYLNVFVAIAQSFQKIPFLKGADPAHPPLAFVVVQGGALIGFCALGYFATKRFHPRATLSVFASR